MDELGHSQRKRDGSFQSWLTSTYASNARPYAEYDYDDDYPYDDIVVDRFVSSAPASDAPTPTSTPGATPPTMSMAVLTLIIVASLSAVVGAIYLLIYFKSIKPMSARSRSYADPSGGKGDEEGARKSAGHPFFRRKWHCVILHDVTWLTWTGNAANAGIFYVVYTLYMLDSIVHDCYHRSWKNRARIRPCYYYGLFHI